MKIILDNIIFSLQKHGGISVVWYEIIKRIIEDPDFKAKFLDYENSNFLRKLLEIPTSGIIGDNLSLLPMNLQRYINPKVNVKEGLFHSSYFRTAQNFDLINITTVHDFTYEHFFKGLPKLIHHQQKGNAIKNSKKIICVSENTKQDLLRFYPKTKENQIEVIYNGVSDEYYPILVPSTEIDKIPIIFDSKDYVLYVGDRRSDYQNFRMLVDACEIMNMHLLIVGGGELTIIEESMLEVKLGYTKFQQLSGMSNSQLNILYNNATFFVYPSLYEGFGIPILEAQKAGCPVICSNQSSIPEVAGNGAYIIENISAQKIADVFRQNRSSSSQTQSIVDAGLINALRFSWNNCYQQTKLVYSDLYSMYF